MEKPSINKEEKRPIHELILDFNIAAGEVGGDDIRELEGQMTPSGLKAFRKLNQGRQMMYAAMNKFDENDLKRLIEINMDPKNRKIETIHDIANDLQFLVEAVDPALNPRFKKLADFGHDAHRQYRAAQVDEENRRILEEIRQSR